MGTHVIRIAEASRPEPERARPVLDPAGTALMVAISGAVLVASLLIASISTGTVPGTGLAAGGHPQPEPHPAMVMPGPGAAPTAP